jgi:hypothetical protein
MVRKIVWRVKWVATKTEDANEEPPRFASVGAVRWIRRNVLIKGADPWRSLVRAGRVFWRKERLGTPWGSELMVVQVKDSSACRVTQ